MQKKRILDLKVCLFMSRSSRNADKHRNDLHNHRSGDTLVQLSLFSPPVEKVADTNMLEKFLDEAINAIKDTLEKDKIKNFLLPLLFYKYLSDLSTGSSSTYNGLRLPSECRWENLFHRRPGETIGQFITRSMHTIASLNPDLQGVLDLAGYEKYRDTDLKDLVAIINRHALSSDSQEFCRKAYEYLLQLSPIQSQSIDESFYTPKEVVSLMLKLTNPDPNGTFYDPSCGSGCLSSLVRNLNLKLGDQNKEARIVGQDRASLASAVTKMDLLFDNNVKIYNQDTLWEPLREKADDLRRFRYIFANIPWNQSGYNKAFYKKDLWKRFDTDMIPPGNTADWGWIQHILASLEDKGQAAVIIDLGALSRGSGSESRHSERDIRKAIIERNIIEAVISLPENLFYGTMAPCGILIFNLKKPEDHKGRILFIDALNTSQPRKGRKPLALSQEESDAIIEAYLHRTMEETFGHVASLEEIRSYDYDLSPALYVAEKLNIDYRPVDVIEQELIEARKKRIDSDISILEYFKRSTSEAFSLKDILKAYISDSDRSRLDDTLRMLLVSAGESRKQELALEMEQRETVSHGLFALDVENVRLGEYAAIGSGFTPEREGREHAEKERAEKKQAKPEEKEEEYAPWVKAGDLELEYVLEVGESLPKKFTEPDSRRAIRPVGALLLALYGGTSTVGKTAVLAIPAVINQAVCCIQPREDMLNRDYLFCYLTYIRKRWGRYLRGSRQNINLLIVKKRLIPLPSIEQQQEIAAKLQPSNERIRVLKQEIALLRQTLRPS
jgi:type I restriction enzyme M protein